MWQRRGGSRRGRASSGGSTNRSRRRPLEWECAELLNFTQTTAPLCDQSVMINTGEYDEEYSDGTLVRCRGHLEVYPTVAPGLSGQFFARGAAGIIELSGQASEDPAAIVDCPYTDCDSDWLWHTYWSVRREQYAGGDAFIDALDTTPFIMDIDSKARRKLESGSSSLWFVFETVEGTVDYWWGVRFLIAEK